MLSIQKFDFYLYIGFSILRPVGRRRRGKRPPQAARNTQQPEPSRPQAGDKNGIGNNEGR
jgi:hypothetical protein